MKELVETTKEVEISNSVLFVVADDELHLYEARIPDCPKHNNILLLIRNTRAERPTDEYAESTYSSGNSTARITCSTFNTFEI